MLIQAVRRLYNPLKRQASPARHDCRSTTPLPARLRSIQDRPARGQILQSKVVLAYNKELKQLNVRDYQVESAKLPLWWVIMLLLYRLANLPFLAIAAIPAPSSSFRSSLRETVIRSANSRSIRHVLWRLVSRLASTTCIAPTYRGIRPSRYGPSSCCRSACTRSYTSLL
jgi:hypothetical protein